MFPEHPPVDGVHPLELVHIYEKDSASQHVLQARAGRLENGFDVLEALLRLCYHIAARETASCRISRTLTRHEHEMVEHDTGEYGPTGTGRFAA